MNVTIVIINKNRYNLLVKCLNSIFTFNTYPDIKVIVVEDGEKNS